MFCKISCFRKCVRVIDSLGTFKVNYSSHSSKWPKRVFSGIQPTGILHVGNYFGAIENWVKLQNDNIDVIFSIVDLHSITLPKEPKELNRSILLMTATLLACGLDPSKCILFQQSKVAEHVLLSWVLGTLTTMTRLYHFPQYKDKSASLKDVPLGLYIYPVLQSADILLYKATDIPVGEDQVQHLHLTQHLVNTFNNKYGPTFPFPNYSVKSDSGAGRIKSLRDPSKKMSKSDIDPKSRIEMTDSADDIVRKIKKSVTDFESKVFYNPESRPGVSNLIGMHSLATGKSHEEITRDYSNIDTGKYKFIVADALVQKFVPIREEILRLEKSPEYLTSVLEDGAKRAREIAQPTWQEVCQKMGLDVYSKIIRKKVAYHTV